MTAYHFCTDCNEPRSLTDNGRCTMCGGARIMRDIIERLMDFEKCGLTAADRVNMRECAAVEIHKLRQEIERLKKSATVTYGDAVEFELVRESADASIRSCTAEIVRMRQENERLQRVLQRYVRND